MLFAVSVVAIIATFMAISFGLQLSMMRLRAAYWENLVKRDSLIRHQWLQKNEPVWHSLVR